MTRALDPAIADLRSRQIIFVRCRCGHEAQILPARLIGQHGVHWQTKVFKLQERLRCKKCRRRPERLWIAKGQD